MNSTEPKIGDNVTITKTVSQRDYTEQAQAKRESLVGQQGKIIKVSNSHGACYEVQTPKGSAYFDEDELTSQS